MFSAIIDVSSANRMLFRMDPKTLTPSVHYHSAFRIISREYTLNNIRDMKMYTKHDTLATNRISQVNYSVGAFDLTFGI